MKLRYKIGLAVLAVVLVKGCLMEPRFDPTRVTLKPDEQVRIDIRPGSNTKQQRVGNTDKTTLTFIPDYGHGYVVTQPTGKPVEIKPRQIGFPLDIGLSTDFRRVGVAVEFFYFRRLDLIGGTHFADTRYHNLEFNLYVAAGYRIPWRKLSNLSVFIGVDTNRKVIGGVFHRFGNS